ncbi:MAG: TraR/DksA family transcriptional regulator [Sediminibacterium sp.]|nr:TraR/DksA family transcriptional regulator [Sediminibacterium sp.]
MPKSAEVKSTKNQEIKKNDILVAPSKENKPIIQIKKDQIKQNIKAVKLPDTLKKKKVESHKQIKPIKIPKLTTTNIKPYKGTYEPIIGREVKVENTLTNDRYNDAELNEFAQLINSKLETAQKTLLVYQNYMTHKDEMGDDMESGRYLTVEDSTVEAERERVAKLAFEQKKFIDHLKSALIRIENKTYGICRITGKLIPKKRLFHVPHATLTVEAKNQINNK